MEFTVELEKWATPESDPNNSGLLTESGRMCCLGFVAKAGGADDKAILGCSYLPKKDSRGMLTPEARSIFFISPDGLYGQTGLVNQAAQINDSENLTQPERMWMLTRLFLSHGHTIRFTRGGEVIDATDLARLRAIMHDPKTLKRERDRRYRAKKRLIATVKAAEEAGLFPVSGAV